MSGSYITVASVAQEEILINRSRFIGYSGPCETEQQALSFLREIRDIHKSATHHCYAYIIGENSGIMRYSDDGEPGGTAGLPIMDVLRNSQIVNCCIVVVRYFGGVLLGTGGLVRAYTQAAQAARDASGLVRMELTKDFSCALPYSSWDRFRYASEHLPVMIEKVVYGSDISFHLLIRTDDAERICAGLSDVSDRKLRITEETEAYHAWQI